MISGTQIVLDQAPRAPGYGAINTAILSVIVPSNYAAGASALSVALSVAVLAVIGRTAQSVGTCSLSVSRPNADGSVTAIPVTSEPLALPAPQAGGPFPTYSQLTFDVSGAEINPGDELLLTLQTQFTESGQGNTLIQIALAQVIFSEQNFATA
jgi:hypothetical protein